MRWMRALVLLPALLLPAGEAWGQEAVAAGAPLRLADVYAAARQRSPRLRASVAAVEARRALQGSAALPPDPSLQLGLMNFSLPGFRFDMPTSMAPSIQLMQMLPLGGKLGLNGRLAQQSTAVAASEAAEAEWEVRAQAAMAFYMVYEAERQRAVMAGTLRWLEDYEQVAKAMYGAGEGRQSDVLRAGVEVARMAAELKRMEAMRTAAAARLNGVLDQPSETPLSITAYNPLPLALPPLDTLRQWALRSRPMLERGRLEVEQANTRGKLARREIWPEPVIGVEYGQRRVAMEAGMPAATERMGSVMLGFTLPVFAGSRQLRMRDEAAAMEQMARADLAGMQAETDARLGELLAGLERTRSILELYRREVLPQARANVASSFASYRAGTVDFMTLVDAQMSLGRYEQERYGMLAEYGQDIAELEMTIGRELPASPATLTETL